jgi:glutathione S-transferase
MADWILHHYWGSPYAEKARLMLGYKGVAWHSVEVSPIPPRPSLQPVLGAFRRIPVLQRGADFFCDTRLLPEVLDSVLPAPLLPPAARPLSSLIADWAEPRAFVKMGPVRFESRDDLQLLIDTGIDPGAFMRDRAPFMAPAVDTRRSATVRESARDHVVAYLRALEGLLGTGTGFLCGERPVAADFSAYHTMWWLRQPPSRDAWLRRFPTLCAWADRMAAIGHGRFEPLAADEALQRARAAQSAPPWQPAWPETHDTRLGQSVQVAADDYGRDPCIGTLVAASDRHVTLSRDAPGVGTVRVHFPKIGFELTLADDPPFT